VDHHTAAGEFQALISLRTEHLRDARDGQVSPKHEKTYRKLLLDFKSACPGPGIRVAVFGGSGTGVFVTAERATFLVQERQIHFDWTGAQRLLHRADAIADQAAEWWPLIEIDETSSRRAEKKMVDNGLERRPHVDRAYNLMTAILSAIDQENYRVLRQQANGEAKDARSDAYSTTMTVIEGEVERAEALLDTAGQRQAQLSYTRGMLVGALALGFGCLLTGIAFYATGTLARDGVALLAGGLGAVVSVLQRMTSGTLRLDAHAGTGMLFRFGALRPWIGAILGMVVFALFAGGLLPAISVAPDEELAFYAAVGFLAGFNERFAQDMIANSGSRVTG
jgi:hypothetical protein